MSRTVDWGLLTLRILVATPMLVVHGWGKAQRLLSGDPVRFADPLHIGAPTTLVLAVLTEFVAPLLVLLGIRTRWAALATATTMSVAFVFIHGGSLTGEHSGELAYVYLVTFLGLAVMGGGRFSVERTP